MKIHEILSSFKNGAVVFGYSVKDPERYGVLDLNSEGKLLGIDEKPIDPKSNFAVPGLYVYDNSVVRRSKSLRPSNRNELEITDLNMNYLSDNQLEVQLLGRGVAWFDAGTSASLQRASSFIYSVEESQSYKIGCPEEIAIRRNLINFEQFLALIKKMPDNSYSRYLASLLPEFDSSNSIKDNAINNLQK